MAPTPSSKVLRALGTKATKYRKLREDARTTRSEIDVLVAEAKSMDVTYAELASVTGMSVAWVQQSLERGKKK